MQSVNIEMFKQAVCFTLTMRKFNNRRQGDMAQVSVDAEKARLKLSKQLIESPEYDAICEYQAELYKWFTNRSNPSFFKDGLYLVKLSEVDSFEKKLAEGRQKLMSELVPALIKVYPEQIEAARLALNGQFRADDYPSLNQLPGKFGIEWNWIAFGVPENLPLELRQAEAAKIEKKFAEAEVQIMDALREGFAQIVSHVTDRLTVEPGAKSKVFRNTLFNELTEFIQTFNARNLSNDSAMEEVVKQANAILEKVRGNDPQAKVEVLRDSSGTRETTANQFASLKARLDEIIVTRPARKFQLED